MRPGQVRAARLHHPAHPAAHRYPPDALRALACPHCGAELNPSDGSFLCTAGHAFDIAKQGYVALLGARARTDTADSADMVAARADFLGSGHFAPIAAAVAGSATGRPGVTGNPRMHRRQVAGEWAADADRAEPALSGPAARSDPLLEIGAGTGYYLRAALDSAGTGSCGISLDSSKYAARRSAPDPRLISVVADAWSALPVRSGSVQAVLSIFAPRDPAEIARVLAPGGLFVGVTPEPGHLAQLRERITLLSVDGGKADRLADSFAGLLTPVGQRLVEFELDLHHADVSALVRMGPSARHLSPSALAGQISTLPSPSTVSVAVTVSVFSKT